MTSAAELPFDLKQVYDSAITYALYTIDLAGKVTSWGIGAERLFGFTAEDMIGNDTAILFTPEDRATQAHKREIAHAITDGCAADYRWHMRKNGTTFWADGTMTPLRDTKGTVVGCLKIAKDITNRKLAQDEIRRLVTVDVLTGLASRSYFDERYPQLLAQSIQDNRLLIAHLIDLDRFKQVNDSYGHHTGDLLLQQAAQRMREVAGEANFLARLGGDEFVLIQQQASNARDAGNLAARMIAALVKPFDINGLKVDISASIGIAINSLDSANPTDLLKKADLALYQAKTRGRNGYYFFTAELDDAAHQRSIDLAGLRQAVSTQNLWVEYQPIIDYRTGKAIAVEALVRFSAPALAAHRTDYLLNLATEAGLTPHIGNWVLGQACGQLKKWKESGFDQLRIHVNMCSQELMDANAIDLIDSVLERHQLQASDLEIEITEREAIDIQEHAIGTLRTLNSRGISLALDDFGTGYSALSYLRNLPVTTLKLDKSFLEGIPQDPHNCAIAKLVLGLARALDLQLIVEGVESVQQAEFLAGAGCFVLQGFLISRPVPAEELTRWLSDNAKSM